MAVTENTSLLREKRLLTRSSTAEERVLERLKESELEKGGLVVEVQGLEVWWCLPRKRKMGTQ